MNLKKSENKEFVELELATKIDIQNLNLPVRKVTNDTCNWCYRCYGCNYGNTSDYLGPALNTNYPPAKSTSAIYYQNTHNGLLHSSWWFEEVWGNKLDIGVPIADENDKVFLADYKPFLQNENYGISSLNYREKWSPSVSYSIGDFVYLDYVPNVPTDLKANSILSSTNKPKIFYVCVESNSNKQPDLNTDIWKQDQCSKTLRGCLLRFQDYVVNLGYDNKALPFGAFPSTFSHENKQ